MWADLLPTFIGGTLTDHDVPHKPTEIIGYTLTDEWVSVTGRDFDFGGKREYATVRPNGAGQFDMHVYGGLSATLAPPSAHKE